MEKWAKAGPTILVPETLVIHTLTSSEPLQPRLEVAHMVESLPLEEGRSERTIQLEHDITTAGRESPVSLLREYRDVFAFGPEEMPGVTLTVMEHRLNADPQHILVI